MSASHKYECHRMASPMHLVSWPVPSVLGYTHIYCRQHMGVSWYKVMAQYLGIPRTLFSSKQGKKG